VFSAVLRGLLPYGVFACCFLLFSRAFPGGGEGYKELAETFSADTIAYNLAYYIKLPAEFFRGAPGHLLIYLASMPLALLGTMRRWRTDYPAMLYCALTLGLYILFPNRQGLRYIFPILPFYISFVLSGLEALCARGQETTGRLRKAFCCGAVLLLFGFFCAATARSTLDRQADGETVCGPFSPAAREMFSFVAACTEPDSVVAFFKPRVMALMSGRKSLRANTTGRLNRTDYLCYYRNRDDVQSVNRQVTQEDIDLLEAQGIARSVFVNNDFSVYRLHRGAVTP